jgi:AraC family transcriptional regulator
MGREVTISCYSDISAINRRRMEKAKSSHIKKANTKQFHIKNMVCSRCVKVVREEFERLRHAPIHIELGFVEVVEDISQTELKVLSEALKINGFEILPDRRGWIIEQVKHTVIDLVQNPHKVKKNYSTYLAEKVGLEYHYLSGLFSSTENITIEQYIILQKVERAKELILYDEMTLSEIAKTMGYSSASHLSNQFRKVTGLSPSYFKELRSEKRKMIDSV